ncbi:restriction endonuclease subunit S [Candidatus Saccharibacteria bacterium]|nr:restriction endonuclease subunit S [Candidatus Saccharibacteria bacterium]
MHKYKLGDVLSEIIDNRGKNPPYYSESGYFVLDNYLFSGGNKYPKENEAGRYIDAQTYDSFLRKTLKKDDVCITLVGNGIGNLCVIPSEKWVTIQNSIGLRCRPEMALQDYLYYYLKCSREAVRALDRGSSQPSILQGDLLDLEISLPDIKAQNCTITLLNALDNKIVSNNKIIETSERLMREIYDYWFVQFDFPDENGRPYKSSGGEMVYDEKLKRETPKGWKVLELGDIIKEAKKSSVQVNGAREKVGTYPFFTSGDEILDFDEYYVDGFNIFLNTGGNADIKSYYGKSAYSTDTWCISADEYSYMLFIFLDSIKEQINNNCFAGSGLKHLQKNAFKKIKIVAPDDNLLRAFNDLAQSFHQAISSYKTESKKLASLRDWLLPMLMNGQIKVSE